LFNKLTRLTIICGHEFKPWEKLKVTFLQLSFKSNKFCRKPPTCSHSAMVLPVVVAIGG